MSTFRLHIRSLHAGISLDFGLPCIYNILTRVTVIVKFVPKVAQVAEIHMQYGYHLKDT